MEASETASEWPVEDFVLLPVFRVKTGPNYPICTAREKSKMFGREFRERQSQTLSDDNKSIQLSFSEEELMPVNRRFMTKMRNNALGLLTGS